MDKTPPKTGSDSSRPTSSKQVKAAARAERLRKQLRENLHRRKAQTRARKAGDTPKAE